MASSVQVFGNLSFTQSSLKKAASQVRSAVSKISVPISITVTKSSISAVKKQIKSSISQVPYAISITVTKASLSAANKQIKSAFGKAGLPQITVHPATIAAINSLARSVSKINSGGLGGSRSGAGGGSASGGGGRGGRRGGFNGALPLGRLSGEASEFSKSMDAATARVFAFGATAIVLGSVGQAFRELVTTTIEVEKRLAEIQAIFGTSDATFAKFRETIFDVASNTGQSFDTVADGAAELARQGLSAAETAKRLNASLVLTRISGIDAKDSVGALTSVINGFSSAGLNANQIINKIVAVDTAFAVSAKDLADGFTRAGSTAEDAGVSFDDLLGLITALQQKTARGGAVIGNGLKTIFTRISRGSVIEDLKALGVQIDASQSGVQKLQAIGQAFEDAKGDPLRQAAIKEKAAGGFQINLISAALKDLNSEQSLFTKASKESSQATNEAFKLNAELNKTMAAQINDVVVSITNMSEKIGQVTFAPALKSFLEFSSTITESFNTSLNPEAGFNFTKGFFSGVGTFIQGPGAVLVLAGFYKIFSIVAGFASQGLKDIFKITLGKKEQLAVDNRINQTLIQNGEISRRIFNSNQSIARQKQAAVALVNREVAAEKHRLNVLKTISTELAKQNAYINADGGISFDKNKRSKFARKAGDVVRSPITAVAGSLAIGAGGEFAKGQDKSKDRVDNNAKQIEKLNKEISGLNEETDKEKISDLTNKIKKLNISSEEFSKKSEEFRAGIDRVTAGLSTAASLALINPQVGAGVAAATIGDAIANALVVPVIDRKTEENIIQDNPSNVKLNASIGLLVTALNPIAGIGLIAKSLLEQSVQGKGGAIDVSNFSEELRKVQRESDKLSRAMSLLGKEVEIGAQTFRSEIKIRSEAQKSFDKNAFGGISSNLELNKGLAGILAGSNSEKVKAYGENQQGGLERQTNEFNFGKINQSILEEAQKKANTQVQDLGFSSTSKVALGEGSLRQKYGGRYDAILNDLGKDSLGGKSLASGLTEGPTNNEEFRDAIKLMAKSLEKTKDLFPSSRIGFDFANEVSKESDAGDTVTRLNELNKAITALPANFDNLYFGDFSKFEELISNIEKIKTSGLVADESIKEYEQIISDYSDRERQHILKKAELDVKNIRDQRVLNDKFITDLKGIYEKNVNQVRGLRDNPFSLTKTERNDPFSESANAKYESVGISAEERAGIAGVTNVGARVKNYTVATSADLKGTLDVFNKAGQNPVIDKASQGILNSNLKNNSLPSLDAGEGASLVPIERRAVRFFYEAENVIKTAQSAADLNKAILLREQGANAVSNLNLDPNSSSADFVQKIVERSGAQTQIAGGVMNTLSLRNPGYVGESTSSNALGSAQTKVGEKLDTEEKSVVNALRETLQPLKDFLENIGKTETTVSDAKTTSLGESSPSAITAVSEFSLKLKEFTESLYPEAMAGASELVIKELSAVSVAAEKTATSFNAAETNANNFSAAMIKLSALIEGIKPPEEGGKTPNKKPQTEREKGREIAERILGEKLTGGVFDRWDAAAAVGKPD